ncbi:MAG: pyrroline-5-carboxylate reductase [Prolixibacteraceae bacterium]|nr:pyrroline-5-carboxylate reductase [Burkholderiales bacterium]
MRILFMGGGNMATALIGGLLQQGFKAGDLRVVDVSDEARQRLQQQFGVSVMPAFGGEIAEDVVLLAVKPQQMRAVAKDLRARLRGQLVISIAAGIRTADLTRWLGGHERIIRVMPNTPALIRSGVSGLFAGAFVNQVDRDSAQSVLGAVGGVVWVREESDIDVVTAISGSGPAYIFYFIEALEEAAVGLGLNEGQAHELAVQTFVGAAKLAAGSNESAAVLRARVTSKAGTTEAALQAMEASGIKRKIVEAVRAAARRSRELGDEFGND